MVNASGEHQWRTSMANTSDEMNLMRQFILFPTSGLAAFLNVASFIISSIGIVVYVVHFRRRGSLSEGNIHLISLTISDLIAVLPTIILSLVLHFTNISTLSNDEIVMIFQIYFLFHVSGQALKRSLT